MRLNLCVLCYLLCGMFALNIYGAEAQDKKFLFDGIKHYERGEYSQAAEVFKRYVGKPVPVAIPFCQDLIENGHLRVEGIPPLPSAEFVDGDEEKKNQSWFKAAKEYADLKTKSQKYLLARLSGARNMQSGPLLYLIGTLFEEGTSSVKQDRQKAIEIYMEAFKFRDPRAILSLARLSPSTNVWGFTVQSIQKIILHVLSKGRDEGHAFFQLSRQAAEKNEFLRYFLYLAAQFGHAQAQFDWATSHCSGHPQSLFWMMHAAEQNNCTALSASAYAFEKGEGAKIDLRRAFGYYSRAAHHPEATVIEFFNFGCMCEDGAGTTPSLEDAILWFGKAYERDKSDLNVVNRLGLALGRVGRYAEASPLLGASRSLHQKAEFNYATNLLFLDSVEFMPEVVEIYTKLASQGFLEAAAGIAQFVLEGKIQFDLPRLKSFFESGIAQEKDSTLVAEAYGSLYDLYDRLNDQFVQESVTSLDIIRKAVEANPRHIGATHALAKELKEVEKYSEALDYLLFLEKAGKRDIFNDIGACFSSLGIKEKQGKQRKEFALKARNYFLKQIAVEDFPQERAMAAYNLYALYNQGRVTPPLPDSELLSYLKMGAEGGDPDAQNDLGAANMLELHGVLQNFDEAERLFKLAVAQGMYGAKVNLMQLCSLKGDEASFSRLFNELFAEYPDQFSSFIETLMTKIEEILSETNSTDDAEDDAEEDRTWDMSFDAVRASEISPPASLPDAKREKEDADIKEGTYTVATAPIATAPIATVPHTTLKDLITSNQLSAAVSSSKKLSKKEQAEAEEQERLQRKYARLMAEVEQLKGTRQTKYRKVRSLIDRQIQAFGGRLISSKGSGRRLKVGQEHSGFHQPHGADAKGGALKSLTDLMDQAARSQEEGQDKQKGQKSDIKK